LLGRQKKTEHPTEALGITIDKSVEKWKIINELITQQKSKIQAMKKWCDELPDAYILPDLKYLLTSI